MSAKSLLDSIYSFKLIRELASLPGSRFSLLLAICARGEFREAGEVHLATLPLNTSNHSGLC